MYKQESKTHFGVLKLSENILYTDPITKEEKSVKLEGIFGYIPCYETYEEAKDASMDGKYQILPIKTL